MNWIRNISKKIKPKISNLFKKKSLAPDDFWASCPSCSSVIDRNDIKNNFYNWFCTNRKTLAVERVSLYQHFLK